MLEVFQDLLIFGGVALAISCLTGAGYYAERYWERRWRERLLEDSDSISVISV
jgi:hypothetical protein